MCPEKDYGVALVLPNCDTEMMQLFVNEVSKKVPEGRHGVLTLDKAAWHTTKKLQLSENLSLLFLPPYSPELNPIEQVWQFLKQYFLSNRIFKDLEEILNECAKAWNAFISKPLRIKSLCSRDWANVAI